MDDSAAVCIVIVTIVLCVTVFNLYKLYLDNDNGETKAFIQKIISSTPSSVGISHGGKAAGVGFSMVENTP